MRRKLPAQEEFEISPANLAELRKAEDTPAIRLVDCREADEFALCRIEGGELRPLSDFARQAEAHLLSDPDTPLIIYCHHGIRSMQATRFLRQRGKENVWSLAGGIDLWSQEIDPEVPRY